MSRQRFNYHVCGLKICSEFDLGIAQAQQCEPDVTLTRVAELPQVEKGKNSFRLQSPVAEIAVVEGNKVFLAIKPGATDETIRLEIIHTILTELLISRNIVCLHGCVVTKKGITAAFIAPSGMGKSTLAAALVKQEWNLVSDDLLLLKIEDNKIIVIPSFSTIRLWEESVEKLALLGLKCPISNRPGKYALDAEKKCDASGRFRLTHLYQLKRSKEFSQIELKKADKKEQFWGLLRNTFPSQVTNREGDLNRFKLFDRLLHEVSYKELRLPDDFHLLESSVEMLLKEIDL
jgi:hypothetical protein